MSRREDPNSVYQRVLAAVRAGDKTPAEISARTGIASTDVSTTLHALRRRGRVLRLGGATHTWKVNEQ